MCERSHSPRENWLQLISRENAAATPIAFANGLAHCYVVKPWSPNYEVNLVLKFSLNLDWSPSSSLEEDRAPSGMGPSRKAGLLSLRQSPIGNVLSDAK